MKNPTNLFPVKKQAFWDLQKLKKRVNPEELGVQFREIRKKKEKEFLSKSVLETLKDSRAVHHLVLRI